MYSKILIPIDGSELSLEAAKSGLEFAKCSGAEALTIYVMQPLTSPMGLDGVSASYPVSSEDYEDAVLQEAQSYLQPIGEMARELGVVHESCVITNYSIAEGICAAAAEHGCDLIYICSHGRSGLSRWLLGSVTHRVISTAPVSVLVHRPVHLRHQPGEPHAEAQAQSRSG